MDEIGFPKNLPNEFKSRFVAYHNENVRLKEEVNSLRRMMFGRKSEKYYTEDIIDPKGTLFNETETIIEEKQEDLIEKENPKDTNETKSKEKENGGRKPLPADLPREIKIHDIPEAEKKCSCGHCELIPIGEDVVEKLELIPAQLKVIEHHYKKYVCPSCEQNVQKAKAEPSILPGAMVESSIISHVAVSKFYFALPLYRQEATFKQMGIEISRMTMARWMIAAADAVLPLVDEMQRYILSNQVTHCDETPVQVLNGTGKEPSAKTYMWVLASGLDCFPAVVFKYYNNRSAACAHDLLKNFNGFLQVDGYGGYNSVTHSGAITRVGCWAHVRRKFDTAYKDGAKAGKELSLLFIEKIKNLFLIEREILHLTPTERVSIRKEKSKQIIHQIRTLIDDNVTKIFPQSKIGSAFGYISDEWPHLLHFLDHGCIALSNNRVENAIRPFAIGRKNWLFANTVNGAAASAALYSLVVSAKENNLLVHAYLTDVFSQIPYMPTDCVQQKIFLQQLLPWNWKKAAEQNETS
jgi:transposase